jgi:single-strand DNA-binding protein
MAKGTLNKVLLVGNLGADPEIRQSPNGNVVATLSIATTERMKDQQTGDWQDHTEWHRVAVFGRTAETARDYLRKGSKVLIEGSLRTRKYQDKNGQDRYDYHIAVQDMQMLDRSGGQSMGGSAGPRERSGGYAPAPQRERAPEPGLPSGGGMDDFDDDIPF